MFNKKSKEEEQMEYFQNSFKYLRERIELIEKNMQNIYKTENIDHKHFWEQSHDAFVLDEKYKNPHYERMKFHPDIVPSFVMNRHQICSICGQEKIFPISAIDGKEIDLKTWKKPEGVGMMK
jgi:hypothetical protein